MSDKPRYPRADAIAVARELVRALTWHCLADRIVVAGSLRRRKAEAGDVEIVYIPRMSESQAPCDLFGRTEPRVVNIADEALGGLLECGIIEQRKNINGAASWGAQNKYARTARDQCQ